MMSMAQLAQIGINRRFEQNHQSSQQVASNQTYHPQYKFIQRNEIQHHSSSDVQAMQSNNLIPQHMLAAAAAAAAAAQRNNMNSEAINNSNSGDRRRLPFKRGDIGNHVTREDMSYGGYDRKRPRFQN